MRTAEEFWKYVDKTGDCWLWTGGRTGRNRERGIVNWCGKPQHAYRAALKIVGRPPAFGQPVHHVCENPLCVNPDHLLLVSGEREHKQHHLQTHCHRGHPMSGSNVGIVGPGRKHTGVRWCRECDRLEWHERKARS